MGKGLTPIPKLCLSAHRGHLITGGDLFGLLLAELLAGDVEVIPEASGAICLTRFLMYSSVSSTSSGVNCGQTLCGDIL